TNAIEAYDKVKENPTINKQSRSASGTLNLPEALAKAFKAIENMNKLVKSYFIDINKTLVDEFELASKILITGVHRTGVEGLVTQNGNAIANATVVLVGTDRVTKTDIDGHYLIAKIKTGDYTVEVSNASGEKASKMIHVSQGHIETLDLTL
ncbi:MAG: carboxypeptidase regulatory-like domain-containing protein, partial [Bacteroidetes bacterium]|nr:carboxypeptidase regulatory-like domain-containing protein [Bacteroidota bacterium]